MLSGLVLATVMVVAGAEPPVGPPGGLPSVAAPTLPSLPPQGYLPPSTPTKVQAPAASAPTPPTPAPITPANPGTATEVAPIPSMLPGVEAPFPVVDPTNPTGAVMAPGKPSLQDTHLGGPYSLWGEVSALTYWLKSNTPPVPLLGGGPAGAPPVVLAGGTSTDYGPTAGIGFNVGTWMNERHTLGIGFSGFITEQRSQFQAANSGPTGAVSLFRPYTDAVLAQSAQILVSNPGLLAGSFFTASDIQLAGAETYLVHNVNYCPSYSFDLLFGLRYLDIDESLSITQVTNRIGIAPLTFNGVVNPALTSLTINDYFRTRNQFWGGTIGARGEYRYGPGFVNLTAKVGMGNIHQVVSIDGSTTPTGAPLAPLPGGILAAQGGNMGQTVSNQFGVLCELGAQAGVQISRNVRLLIGYDFLYLNDVARAGSQIDPVINTRLLPASATYRTLTGITAPLVTGARSDFYASGVRFGVELRY